MLNYIIKYDNKTIFSSSIPLVSVVVKYNGDTLYTINQTKTIGLETKNKHMLGELKIGDAILDCSERFMKDNISIIVTEDALSPYMLSSGLISDTAYLQVEYITISDANNYVQIDNATLTLPLLINIAGVGTVFSTEKVQTGSVSGGDMTFTTTATLSDHFMEINDSKCYGVFNYHSGSSTYSKGYSDAYSWDYGGISSYSPMTPTNTFEIDNISSIGNIITLSSNIISNGSITINSYGVWSTEERHYDRSTSSVRTLTPSDTYTGNVKLFSNFSNGIIFGLLSTNLNLIPCYRKSDNMIGFYNNLNSTFILPNTQNGISKGANR